MKTIILTVILVCLIGCESKDFDKPVTLYLEFTDGRVDTLRGCVGYDVDVGFNVMTVTGENGGRYYYPKIKTIKWKREPCDTDSLR